MFVGAGFANHFYELVELEGALAVGEVAGQPERLPAALLRLVATALLTSSPRNLLARVLTIIGVRSSALPVLQRIERP